MLLFCAVICVMCVTVVSCERTDAKLRLIHFSLAHFRFPRTGIEQVETEPPWGRVSSSRAMVSVKTVWAAIRPGRVAYSLACRYCTVPVGRGSLNRLHSRIFVGCG